MGAAFPLSPPRHRYPDAPTTNHPARPGARTTGNCNYTAAIKHLLSPSDVEGDAFLPLTSPGWMPGTGFSRGILLQDKRPLSPPPMKPTRARAGPGATVGTAEHGSDLLLPEPHAWITLREGARLHRPAPAAFKNTSGLTGHQKPAAGEAWGQRAQLQSVPAPRSSPTYSRSEAFSRTGLCSRGVMPWCVQTQSLAAKRCQREKRLCHWMLY